MALYVTNELAFEVPDESFEDRTLHEFDASLPGDSFLSLLVVRTPLPPETGLRSAVRSHVEVESRRLTFHHVIEVRERLIAGSEAVEVLSGWAHLGRKLYVREAHLAAPGLRLTFSTTAPLEHREVCDAYFERMISTLELNPR